MYEFIIDSNGVITYNCVEYMNWQLFVLHIFDLWSNVYAKTNKEDPIEASNEIINLIYEISDNGIFIKEILEISMFYMSFVKDDLNWTNYAMIFLACLILAQKNILDIPYSNRSFNNIFNINPRMMYMLECSILKAANWRLPNEIF
jgi:hypothetical protein